MSFKALKLSSWAAQLAKEKNNFKNGRSGNEVQISPFRYTNFATASVTRWLYIFFTIFGHLQEWKFAQSIVQLLVIYKNENLPNSIVQFLIIYKNENLPNSIVQFLAIYKN